MKISVFMLSIILAVLVSSCCHEVEPMQKNACTGEFEPDEIGWITNLKNSMTNCTCEMSLFKGTYQGETVFFIELTDPVCDGINTPTLYSCTGEEIRTFTTSLADQKDLYEDVTRDDVVYSCKD